MPGEFPNRETMIGAVRGPRPGRPPGALFGKRRGRRMKRASQMNAAINGPEPAFSGDALSYFQEVYRDRSLPTELRLVAARCAVQFERPTMGSNGASHPDVRGGLAERLGDARARLGEPTTRRERIEELAGKLGYTPPTIEGAAQPVLALPKPAPDPAAAALEAENERLRRAIAELELQEAIAAQKRRALMSG